MRSSVKLATFFRKEDESRAIVPEICNKGVINIQGFINNKVVQFERTQ